MDEKQFTSRDGVFYAVIGAVLFIARTAVLMLVWNWLVAGFRGLPSLPLGVAAGVVLIAMILVPKPGDENQSATWAYITRDTVKRLMWLALIVGIAFVVGVAV